MKEKVYIRDFFETLRKYQKPLLIIMGVSLLSLVQLSFILPKSYKSEFELNIYSKYFNNGLIAELVPGVNSTPEMTQTVESMVKEVMNDKLIDDIGIKYKIYPSGQSNYELSKSRQLLRDQIEMFSGGGNSYHIGFIHSDPNLTFEVTKELLERVRNHFINTRIQTIEVAQQTILKKLESANVTSKFTGGSEGNGNNIVSKNPTVLLGEINKIDQEISSLKLQFNANHPSIVKLEQRKKTISGWLSEMNVTVSGKANEAEEKDTKFAPLLMSNDKETSKNITSKLYANFNNINIALDIERKSVATYIGVTLSPQLPTSPLFPKKRLFASLGFVVGLIFCFGYVFYKEVMRADPVVNAEFTAKDFNTKFFGVLPRINEENLMSKAILQIEDGTKAKALEYNPDK
jgi:uncharacterized protein involved in exopolysaccharide biosynthesis